MARRQTHQRAKRCRCQVQVIGDDDLVNKQLDIVVRHNGIVPLLGPQMIERRIVRDAKQPAFEVAYGRIWQGVERLCQRILNDVLAIDDRTGHAGAIAMELRAQRPDKLVEILPCYAKAL